MDKAYEQIWSILDDVEDLVKTGRRTEHPPLCITPATRSQPIQPIQDSQTNAAGPDSLKAIDAEIFACHACNLAQRRHRPVPGEGCSRPDLMLIGEGPGADEDRSGHPFVGRAGQYLDKWLAAIKIDREHDCFIGNIVKCRPPGNRDPLPDETAACLPYLKRQIALLKPKVIVTLGRIATQILTGQNQGITRMRGQRYEYLGIPLIPTFHPSAVLRNPNLRAAVWSDLQYIRRIIDE